MLTLLILPLRKRSRGQDSFVTLVVLKAQRKVASMKAWMGSTIYKGTA